jgi:hypothetical protein
LKSAVAPARILLRHCPEEFYQINYYLFTTVQRHRSPNYTWLADRMNAAMERLKKEAGPQSASSEGK